MAIDRRHMLLGATAGAAAGLGWLAAPVPLPAKEAGPEQTGAGYIGLRWRAADKRSVAVLFDADGTIRRETALPARGHGIAVRPDRAEAVVMARRPGTFGVVFALASDGKSPAPCRFQTRADRHFQGHAAYDAEGRILYATENDYEAGRGVIGLYDTRDGYRRIGEIASGGIGAHELLRMPGGDRLVVANGGILTHPGTGRAKLNIASMTPSLAYIDIATGRIAARIVPPAGPARKLSIRHIAVLADGTVALACQDQQSGGTGLPLVALHRPGAEGFSALAAPETVQRAMAGYCGSIAADPSGRIIAASAPRGNLIVFWDGETGACLGPVAMTDGCGIAPGPRPGSFLLTSGTGLRTLYDPRQPHALAATPDDPAPWDNHLRAV